MSDYSLFTIPELNFLQTLYFTFFIETFKESVEMTMAWWELDATKIFFQERQERMTNFFEESGISEEWNKFVEERANKGADIVEQIYDYSREKRMGDDVIPYTEMEKRGINELCDYNYELIKDVTEQQIKDIRQCLIQDYAEGRNSADSTILEKLEQIQLESIHTFSAEQRARMIARTETSRITNRATLDQMRKDGVKYVTYHRSDTRDCKICDDHCGDKNAVPIDQAIMGDSIFHPNCSCTPVPVADENGFFIPPEED